MGYPGGSDGKESDCNVRDLASIPGLGKSSGGGDGNSLQYSWLESVVSSRTEEPFRLQSMGSQRVGRDWVTKHTQHTYYVISFSEQFNKEML